VTISTIQRLYSIMRGERLTLKLRSTVVRHRADSIRGVSYSSVLPIEFYDVIIIDECHRSIYGYGVRSSNTSMPSRSD